jgi:hypothetical protein
MSEPQKGRRPDGTGRQVNLPNKRAPILPHRPAPAQVQRLRLTARCLDLVPVFVGDSPLDAELFDARGQLMERWAW